MIAHADGGHKNHKRKPMTSVTWELNPRLLAAVGFLSEVRAHDATRRLAAVSQQQIF